MHTAWLEYLIVLVCSLLLQGISAQEPLVLEIPDRKTLLAEDERLGLSARFASPLEVDIDPHHMGTWTAVASSQQLWQLPIQAPGAAGLFLAIDRLQLPSGASLALKTRKGQLIDQIKAEDLGNKTKYLLAAENHTEVVLEYQVPVARKQLQGFHVFKIFHVYKYAKGLTEDGVGELLECHVNSACADLETAQNYGQGTVRILRYFDQGLAWCTGALINNTKRDQTPYLLTAFHCIDGLIPDYELWRFDFGHATLDCAGEIIDNEQQSLVGAKFRAGWQATDFLLLELIDQVPLDFQPYFLGWNAQAILPDRTMAFHHPNGRIKMMSMDQDMPMIETSAIRWSNQVSTPAGHHLVVQFDEGTQETGSSGAPLLNQHGQVVGQLHGGNANCQQNKSYFGWMAKSWAAGPTQEERLDHWLAPAGSELKVLAGFAPAKPALAISGKVSDQYGEGMPEIALTLSAGEESWQTATDALGNYFFTGLSDDKSYAVRPTLVNNQAGEIIIKIKDGKRMATFTSAHHAGHPGSKQSAIQVANFDLIFDKVYPNQIDIEALQFNLQALDFTVIKK